MRVYPRYRESWVGPACEGATAHCVSLLGDAESPGGNAEFGAGLAGNTGTPGQRLRLISCDVEGRDGRGILWKASLGALSEFWPSSSVPRESATCFWGVGEPGLPLDSGGFPRPLLLRALHSGDLSPVCRSLEQ